MRDIRGVVGEVQEQADVVHGTVLLKVGLEEPGRLHVHLVKKRNMMIVLINVCFKELFLLQAADCN